MYTCFHKKVPKKGISLLDNFKTGLCGEKDLLPTFLTTGDVEYLSASPFLLTSRTFKFSQNFRLIRCRSQLCIVTLIE